MASTSITLYDVETQFLALLDTEAVVPPGQEEAFRAELAETLKTAVEKRDRVAQFILHCENQAEHCKAEAERLKAREKHFTRAADRMREYVRSILEASGTDAKGKTRKLDGNTATFSLRAKPASVEITNESAIPAKYKTVTITMRMEDWEEHIQHYQELREMLQRLLAGEAPEHLTDRQPLPAAKILSQIKKTSVSVDKTEIKTVIEAGFDVPGADLSIGGTSLVLK